MNQLKFLPHDIPPQRQITVPSATTVYGNIDSRMNSKTKDSKSLVFEIKDQGEPLRRRSEGTSMVLGPLARSRQFHNNWSKRVHDLLLGKCASPIKKRSTYKLNTGGLSLTVPQRVTTCPKAVNTMSYTCPTYNAPPSTEKGQQTAVELHNKATSASCAPPSADAVVQHEPISVTTNEERNIEESKSSSSKFKCHKVNECISPLSNSLLSSLDSSTKICGGDTSSNDYCRLLSMTKAELHVPEEFSGNYRTDMTLASASPPTSRIVTDVISNSEPNISFHSCTRDHRSPPFPNDQQIPTSRCSSIDIQSDGSFHSDHNIDNNKRHLYNKKLTKGNDFHRSIISSSHLGKYSFDSIPLYFDPGPGLSPAVDMSIHVTSPQEYGEMRRYLPRSSSTSGSSSNGSTDSYFKGVMGHLFDRCDELSFPAHNLYDKNTHCSLSPQITPIKRHNIRDEYGPISQRGDAMVFRYSNYSRESNPMQCVAFTHLATPSRRRSTQSFSGNGVKDLGNSLTSSQSCTRYSSHPLDRQQYTNVQRRDSHRPVRDYTLRRG